MTKFASLIVLFFFTYSISNGQSVETTVVSKKLVKDFVSSIRPTVITNKLRLSEKPKFKYGQEILERIISTDSIFNSLDLAFIQKQIKESEDYIWDGTLADSAQFIRKQDIDSIFSLKESIPNRWTIFRKKFGGSYYDASIPFFTQDLKTCIIYIGYHCGELCGEGAIRIYRFSNGQWRLYRTIGHWVS